MPFVRASQRLTLRHAAATAPRPACRDDRAQRPSAWDGMREYNHAFRKNASILFFSEYTCPRAASASALSAVVPANAGTHTAESIGEAQLPVIVPSEPVVMGPWVR